MTSLKQQKANDEPPREFLVSMTFPGDGREPAPSSVASIPPKFRQATRLVGPYLGEDIGARLPETALFRSYPQAQIAVVAIPGTRRVSADESATIGDFPGEPYQVKELIPVRIQRADDTFLATFEQANISMTGNSRTEAIGNLAADILDTYELYSAEEDNLGPEPIRQLSILRRYIAKRQPL